MNPAFMILVILICVILWTLMSALYKPIGRLIYKIVKDAADILNEKDEEEETK